jgi:hypothetical protein
MTHPGIESNERYIKMTWIAVEIQSLLERHKMNMIANVSRPKLETTSHEHTKTVERRYTSQFSSSSSILQANPSFLASAMLNPRYVLPATGRRKDILFATFLGAPSSHNCFFNLKMNQTGHQHESTRFSDLLDHVALHVAASRKWRRQSVHVPRAKPRWLHHATIAHSRE